MLFKNKYKEPQKLTSASKYQKLLVLIELDRVTAAQMKTDRISHEVCYISLKSLCAYLRKTSLELSGRDLFLRKHAPDWGQGYNPDGVCLEAARR